jgi:hypothetical protein
MTDYLDGIDLASSYSDPVNNTLASLGVDPGLLDLTTPISSDVLSSLGSSTFTNQLNQELANLTSSLSNIGLNTPISNINGTGLYSTSPTQIGAIDQTTGTGLQGTLPSLNSTNYSTGAANYNIAGTTAGVDPNTGTGFGSIQSIADMGANQDAMGGGQGLTKYIPAQFNSDGSVVSGTGGTLTSLGFIPDNATAGTPTLSLGNPNSYINNPNVTGNSAVIAPNQVSTPTGTFGVSPNVTKVDTNGNVTTTTGGSTSGSGTQVNNNTGSSSGPDLSTLLGLLAAAGLLGSKGGGSSSTTGSTFIPTLTASRPALNYTPPKAGEANVQYFSPVTYAAEGGQMHGGISTLGSYSDGGHLLKGPGDGVSDSIPATIGGHQPARLADGEFVIPARIVSELGNGSTDAGARKLYAMMDRIKKTRSQAKDIAADTKAEKHLPA